jgi:hypothetical protein
MRTMRDQQGERRRQTLADVRRQVRNGSLVVFAPSEAAFRL